MAITPLSTPLKTEYKPLGLEAFAQPLSDMQAKFDVAKSQIDDTEYTLSRLSKDDDRAKEKLEDLNEKTSQLAENLIKTGNYRQATQKLKDLNKYYAKDAEILGISKNYKNYQEGLKKMQEGKYTKEDIDVWKAYTLGKFKGTEYDPSTGSYTEIDASPKIENLEDEIREEALKLVAMAPTKVNEYFENVGVDSRVKATLKQKLASGQGLAYEDIVNFLGTSTKYKNYLNEDAKMKFFVGDMNSKKTALAGQSDNYFAFQDQIAEKGINYYDNFIQQYQKDQAAGVDRSKELKIATDNRNNILELEANKFNDPEAYGRLTETLYRQDKLGYLRNVAGAAADIVDNRSLTYGEIKETSASKANKEALKKQDEIGTIIASPSAFAGQTEASPITAGVATATYGALENAGIENPNVINNFNKNLESAKEEYKTVLGKTTSYQGQNYSTTDYELPKTIVNDVEITTLLDRQNTIEAKRNEYKTSIADLRNKQSDNSLSFEERSEATQQLKFLLRENNNLTAAESDQTKVLDSTVTMQMNNFIKNKPDNIDDKTYKDVKTIYEKNKNNSVKFLNELNNYAPTADLENKIISRDQAFEMLKKEDPLAYGPMSAYGQAVANLATPDALNIGQSQEIIDEVNNQIEAYKNSYNINIKAESDKDFSTNMVNGILNTFTNSLTIDNPAYAKAPNVQISESSNKLSDGKFEELFEVFSTQLTDRSYKAVSIDRQKGTVDASNIESSNFDPLLYNFEKPTYVGKYKDSDGNLREVYQLNRQVKNTTDSVALINRPFAASGMPVTTSTADRLDVLSGMQQNEWEKENPAVVYIENLSNLEPTTDVKRSITDQIKATMSATTGEERKRRLTESLNNYSYFHLIEDPQRKNRYTEQAFAMQEAAKKGVTRFFTQTSDFEQEDKDGNLKSFKLEYEVRGNKIFQTPIEIRTTPGGQNVPGYPQRYASEQITNVENLPLTLIQNDFTYGTGEGKDLLTIDNNPIIPAMMIDNY